MKDMNNANKAYEKHLLELGHGMRLSQTIIDGFDAWYSKVLPENKSASILDFGCGLGDFIEYLQIKGYSMIEGADSNPLICTVAAKRTSCPVGHILDVETFTSSRKENYDFINLKDVLEHIEPDKAERLLSSLNKMLKPNGILIVSCPQICGFTSMFTLYNDYTHLKLFTFRSLKYLIQLADFEEPVLIHPSPKWKITPSSILFRMIRGLWFIILKILYFIERPGEEKTTLSRR